MAALITTQLQEDLEMNSLKVGLEMTLFLV
jgi:hypothetical protein